ncbi:cellular tumor antigen p53-like isoform X3 [Periplaneta americana]
MNSFPEDGLNSSLLTNSEMDSWYIIDNKIHIVQNGSTYVLPLNSDTTAQELPVNNCQSTVMNQVPQQGNTAEICSQVKDSGDFRNPGMEPHSSGQISGQDVLLQRNFSGWEETFDIASVEQNQGNIDNQIPQEEQVAAVHIVSQEELPCGVVMYDATCENLSDVIDPGRYNFRFSFGDDSNETKWKFSNTEEKLYIDLNRPIEIGFGCSADTVLQKNLFIRLTLVFKNREYLRNTVERCMNHAEKKNNINRDNPDISDHVIWCEDRDASYEINPISNRRSVIVPYGVPCLGDDMVRKLIRFMCYTSCHKRPTNLIMTLENGREILGRRVIEVKVCANPKRDFESEEKKGMKGKKRKIVSQEDEPEFTLVLPDEETYEQCLLMATHKLKRKKSNGGLTERETELFESYQSERERRKL